MVKVEKTTRVGWKDESGRINGIADVRTRGKRREEIKKNRGEFGGRSEEMNRRWNGETGEKMSGKKRKIRTQRGSARLP